MEVLLCLSACGELGDLRSPVRRQRQLCIRYRNSVAVAILLPRWLWATDVAMSVKVARSSYSNGIKAIVAVVTIKGLWLFLIHHSEHTRLWRIAYAAFTLK